MMQKEQTRIAKNFLHSVNLNYIRNTLDKINLDSREKIIINYLLDKKTNKEMAINLNLSLSYIALLKQGIYCKISSYLLEQKEKSPA